MLRGQADVSSRKGGLTKVTVTSLYMEVAQRAPRWLIRDISEFHGHLCRVI